MFADRSSLIAGFGPERHRVADFGQRLVGRDESELVYERRPARKRFRRYADPIPTRFFNLILSMLADPYDARTATQEVFKAFKATFAVFATGSSMKTWLYRIAILQPESPRGSSYLRKIFR